MKAVLESMRATQQPALGRRVRRALAVAGVSWLLAAPGTARADETQAEVLFHAGRSASARGDHTMACAYYRASYRLENAVGTLLNIALCEEALGELASAWQHYREVVSRLPAGDERLAWTHERMKSADARLPRLTIQVDDPRPETLRIVVGSLELDGRSLGVALPFNPGSYEIRVLSPGHEPRTYRVELELAEHESVHARAGLRIVPPPRTAGALTRAKQRRPERALSSDTRRAAPSAAYYALGAGALGFIASAVAGVLVLDRKATVDAHCDGDRRCDATGIAAGNSGANLFALAAVGFAVGVTGTATGLVLLNGKSDARPTSARARGASLGAAPAGLSGSF
jgi:hypothetical protein